MIIKAFNIKYDTGGELIEELPTEYAFELDEAYFNPEAGDLSDLITEETGWLVESLEYEIVECNENHCFCEQYDEDGEQVCKHFQLDMSIK